ncbi:hypothetical protein BC751_1891 [Cecembia calidifontis]|uniref:Uncharacterized protein n=1 Tax=Cecembia calidifontis TaxID=1187080 RepID=A0A4Q7PC04_9BACT|nr:hypothetical protein BC751_1891 [Cecembia calidifontis]
MRSKIIRIVFSSWLFGFILCCEQKSRENSILENEEIKFNYKNSEFLYSSHKCNTKGLREGTWVPSLRLKILI